MVVEIPVHNIKRSTEFYRRLGFELIRENSTFAEFKWDSHLLFLAEQRNLPQTSVFPPPNIRVMVPNVDDYWHLVQELGASVINPISDRDYGLRDFIIVDPDGFGVQFATKISDI
ncbi:hypothetical protein NIES4074_06710 [Cylindrospermum sp. NIES-4074]|jgi:catechol 2,3-dioxygenase-like lactoylglutathione lyase family enzyme|nr:hypothetical protein NIES4074_06710 [Cylindrospermum sp. NIES-4074]